MEPQRKKSALLHLTSLASDGEQRPLLRCSRCPPRLTPGVDMSRRLARRLVDELLLCIF